AAFGERAAELTLEPDRRARRELEAARAKHQAGAPDSAMYLLEMAQAGPLDRAGLAQAELLGAQLAADSGQDRDAPHLLLKAASNLGKLDPAWAREAYRDAFRAVLDRGRMGVGGGMLEVAEAVEAAELPPQSCAADLLLRGMARLMTEGCAAAVPELRRAVDLVRQTQDFDLDADGLQWLRFSCLISREIWDYEGWQALSVRLVRRARQSGALMVLPHALLESTANRLLAGELTAAMSLSDEAERVMRITVNGAWPYGRLMLSAWTGREAETVQLAGSAADSAGARGEGRWLTTAAWATAVLRNGLGHYDQALAAAEQGSEYADDLGLAHLSEVELIEAAARLGRPNQASDALERLSKATTASGTDWGLGIQARSQALMSDGDVAECRYRESIRRLGRTGMRTELARAHLLYGEWLRRERRRTDAREHLRTACEMLNAMGIRAFAERAARELRATGETTQRSNTGVGDALTPQETQVARLALEGLSNPEIGARLFISVRTVQYHLSKVFAKLGITSRTQLHRVLPVRR
ncbi:MAG: helix-turn-helix transcriptional regulator, partial [Actinobacteria bacterium]|nr:helix-turn-helix transcriptional regulator [Actinomycetota bacterium]